MAPRTRSSTRTAGMPTGISSAQTQGVGGYDAQASKPSKNVNATAKAGPKPKPKPKAKSKLKKGPEPARKRVRRLGPERDAPTTKAPATMLLVNLPVEVLIEIARYVHPLDLVMLSRVNKFFRELLMDRRSALIWRSARENLVGLPACPEEVSEPQYAAMLFAKRCSSCGGYAPREMNPVLMVRLCSHCWREELVDYTRVTDPSLVTVISGPVSGESRRWKSWCSLEEAKAVKLKLNELNEAGDEEALQRWKEERRQLVAGRKKNAEPLSVWLIKREQEQAQNREVLKITHREEVESRLIKLGWEKGDFVCYDRWRRKQWNSMVYTTKALTDKVWDHLLPRLLGHLRINRDQRLERELERRQAARRGAIFGWFGTVRAQLAPYAQTTVTDETLSTTGITLSIATGFWEPFNHENVITVNQAFPCVSQIYEWPEYTTLVDEDVPHEEFLVAFEGKKAEFQQSITNWRHSLEEHLVTILPDDTHLPNFDISPVTMAVGTADNVQLIGELSGDNQKLLRADAIFANSPLNDHSMQCYYPHNFNNFRGKMTKIIIHSEAHEIAQALLSALGIPDASHLSLRALGRTFRCGRCPQSMAVGQSWREIINHYLESIRSWKAVGRQRRVQSNKDFVYICTHDVNTEDLDRPLVRVTAQTSTQGNGNPGTSSSCVLCCSAGLNDRMNSQAVVDHVRYVHLIEEPEAGVHYK